MNTAFCSSEVNADGVVDVAYSYSGERRLWIPIIY